MNRTRRQFRLHKMGITFRNSHSLINLLLNFLLRIYYVMEITESGQPENQASNNHEDNDHNIH